MSENIEITERGIIFSDQMVRALLSGRKTVTRRLSKQWLKMKPGDRLWVRETFALERYCTCARNGPPFDDGRPIKRTIEGEYGERWTQPHYRATDPTPALCCDKTRCRRCEEDGFGPHWQPSIHMPRWASRITLEITEEPKLENIQDITESEAMHEGFYQAVRESESGIGEKVVGWFADLWMSLYDKPGERWDDNPEVIRIPFRRLT